MTAEEIKTEMESLEKTIKPLRERYDLLERELRTLSSKEFIRDNGITRDQVQMSDVGDAINFQSVEKFVSWLKSKPVRELKPWTEWNGGINRTSDLLAGKPTSYVGNVRDLE